MSEWEHDPMTLPEIFRKATIIDETTLGRRKKHGFRLEVGD